MNGSEDSVHSPCLNMSGVKKSFGPTKALQGVDLTLYDGEVLALLGENGAGKSTLMKILSGALLPDEGSITLFGQPYEPASPLHGREAGIGMIYQELSLASHLSIEENILLGVEPMKGPFIDAGKRESIAKKALETLGLQSLSPKTPVRDLPPAHQQMVEIGRAVAAGCRVLIFDEPTSSLTLEDAEKLFTLIRSLRESGHAIIYISHFLEEIMDISDRYLVIRDGSTVGEGETSASSMSDLAAMMVGRNVDDLYPHSLRKPGECVLEAKTLSAPPRLQSASFSLYRGEILGIAGLVGAGRTELLRAIMGLDQPTDGTLRINGNDQEGDVITRWRQGLGILSENRKEEGLAQNLSISDNMTLTRLDEKTLLGILSPDDLAQQSQKLAETLRLKCDSVNAPVSSLSGGNQQKVAIGRLLHHKADILLFDEPTRGIDIGSKAEIYKLMDELASGNEEEGIPAKAIIMVSSYLPELLGVCDRIAVMCRGVLQEPRPASERNQHEIMLEATGVTEAA